MKDESYPYLFRKSDEASLQQQKFYLRATKIEFVFILTAAFSSGFMLIGNTKASNVFAIATAVTLGLAFLTRIFIKILNWEREWFDTRAIAESVKTITWRYIMAAEPYSGNLLPADVDKMFANKLTEIFKARPEAHSSMAACVLSEGQQITDRMREIRGLSVDGRKTIYVNQRVKDQRKWYRLKAKSNRDRDSRGLLLIVGCEFVGVAIAVCVIFFPEILFNPLGTVTTLAAVFCAWVQIKRHGELSQSYAVAEQELASSESLANHVKTEDALREYVINTEGAISREHTMWCAKRI